MPHAKDELKAKK